MCDLTAQQQNIWLSKKKGVNSKAEVISKYIDLFKKVILLKKKICKLLLFAALAPS